MENRVNKQIQLASRPSGMATESNFKIVDIDIPQPNEGEVLIRSLYISVDPYLRGRMNEGKSYTPPFQLNQPITSGVVGEIIESRSNSFKSGDIVVGYLPWQLFSIGQSGNAESELRKVEPKLAPVTTALGVLGMPGLTGYFGLLDIGKPKPGETVVVSGAAGAVGTVVCQIAKIKGCRVVAIAGSNEKNHYLVEQLGVDAAINYKNESGFGQALRDACPNGVDVYFDNVGGVISDSVMPLINDGARVVICGLISMYNLEKPDTGPRIQPYVLVHRALIQGFIITDYLPRFAEGIMQMAQWLGDGKLKYTENIIDGFENAPRAFLGLFVGENLGKQLVRVV